MSRRSNKPRHCRTRLLTAPELLEQRVTLAGDLGSLVATGDLPTIDSAPIAANPSIAVVSATENRAQQVLVTPEPTSPRVHVDLQVVDDHGNPVEKLDANEETLLNVYVKDTKGMGVFAAYFDIHYDPDLFEMAGEVTYGPAYQNGRTGDPSTPGLIDEVGAFAGFSPLGRDRFLLFSVRMRAKATADADFSIGSPDWHGSQLLVYGNNDAERLASISTGDSVDILDVTVERNASKSHRAKRTVANPSDSSSASIGIPAAPPSLIEGNSAQFLFGMPRVARVADNAVESLYHYDSAPIQRLSLTHSDAARRGVAYLTWLDNKALGVANSRMDDAAGDDREIGNESAPEQVQINDVQHAAEDTPIGNRRLEATSDRDRQSNPTTSPFFEAVDPLTQEWSAGDVVLDLAW